MKIYILKYSGFLLLGLLVEYWIVWHSPLNISQNIPRTTIKTEGLLLFVLFLSIIITVLNTFFKSHPNTSLLKLGTLGTVICFISLSIFHAVRQIFINADTLNDSVYYFLLGTIGVSTFGAILSFLVAFQIRTKKTGQLILLIIGMIILSNIVQYVFQYFSGNFHL